MGQKVSRNDFEWTDSKEPHSQRRKEILSKHPEIKNLFGFDTSFKWKLILLVIVQLFMLPIVSNLNWGPLFLVAYCFGGFVNQALILSFHDLSHNTAFGQSRPSANKMLAVFANLPVGIPAAASFKKYHSDHHRYQGDEVYDSDVPTEFEGKLFCSTFGKFIWVILQPLFYTVRPLYLNLKPITNWEIINATVQFSFDFLVYYFFGGKAIFYLIGGTLLSSGLHPVAGHFISEHYMFKMGFETYSYYGPLNCLTWNVGYHNEHHDFPSVPACYLPKVREIAKEYYDALPHHDSWIKVIYDFITDPSVGPYCRMKRKNREKAMKTNLLRSISKFN